MKKILVDDKTVDSYLKKKEKVEEQLLEIQAEERLKEEVEEKVVNN